MISTFIFSPNHGLEKASASASQRASVTVEAVVCVPLFVYAAVCLIWRLEIRITQNVVRSGIQAAAKVQAVVSEEIPVFFAPAFGALIVNYIGAERLNRSLIAGGSSGISCLFSYMDPDTGIMELDVRYKIALPVPYFSISPIECKEKMRVKSWVGYTKDTDGEDAEETVYVTDYGTVYHKDSGCSYLNPSVRTVSITEVGDMRSHDGSVYYPCEDCGGSGALVFITGYGNRYHRTTSCSGIKRGIHAIPLSEAAGRGGCSKCAN